MRCLQSIQNTAARLAMGTAMRQHLTNCMPAALVSSVAACRV